MDKIMKRIIFTVFTLATAIGIHADAFAWGRDGHAAIAYIAELNLTPRAKENVEKCIDGHSIVYYASWLDYHRKEHKAWNKRRHTCDFDLATDKPIGKPVKQMRETLRLLENYENMTDSARKFHIYTLVHTMGDFHCPGHTEYRTPDCKTVLCNSFYNVRYLDEKKPMNYHKVWDTMVVIGNHADWGYMDYGHILNDGVSQERKDAIVAGTLEEWLEESARTSKVIFERAPKAAEDAELKDMAHVDRDMLNGFDDLACEQMLKAGLRLAKVLNDIFDK